jgi:hypothetical protein
MRAIILTGGLFAILSGCAKTSYVAAPSVAPVQAAVSGAAAKNQQALEIGDREDRKAVLIDRWLETHKPKVGP